MASGNTKKRKREDEIRLASTIFAGIRIILIALIVVLPFTAASKYPDEIVIQDVLSTWDTTTTLMPFFNSRSYLSALSIHVAKEKPRHVMVVVGPKDIGKSAGIMHMKPYWQRAGHVVIDINLKGKLSPVNGFAAFKIISKELMAELNVDFAMYAHLINLHEHGTTECTDKLVPGQMEGIVRKTVINHMDKIIGLVAPTLVYMFFNGFFRKVRKLYKNMKCAFWLFITITCVAGALIFLVVTVTWQYPYYVNMLVQSYDAMLEEGDWESLMCLLNSFAHHHPSMRPILIVRELINLDNKTLSGCLRSMETTKEGCMLFPVILETSDNLWFNVPAVKKSRASFEPYYVRDMTFEEGRYELVERMQIWSQEEYKLIYAEIGGHGQSYQKLWELVKYRKRPLEESLNIMKETALIHLHDCIIQANDRHQIINTLKDLKSKDFIQKAVHIGDTISYLINCNILFYDGVRIYPQKRLLLRAIDEFLTCNETKMFLKD